MKIEIEIGETEIAEKVSAETQSALAKAIERAVQQKLSHWNFEASIRNKVDDLWDAKLDEAVKTRLKDIPNIQDAVKARIEAKIKAKLEKLMREDSK